MAKSIILYNNTVKNTLKNKDQQRYIKTGFRRIKKLNKKYDIIDDRKN